MKVGLKPRENTRTRGKGHRHTCTLTVHMWRQRCAHTHLTCTHTFTCRSERKRATERHCHSPLKCVWCLCRGPTLFGEWKNADNERLSGWCVKMNVCVTEAAWMFIAVAPEVKPCLRLHSSLGEDFPVLYLTCPCYLSDLRFFLWSDLHHTQTHRHTDTQTHTHTHTHTYIHRHTPVTCFLNCFLSPVPHFSVTVSQNSSCNWDCGHFSHSWCESTPQDSLLLQMQIV